MADKKFSIDESLGFSWKALWPNFLPLLGFFILTLLLHVGPSTAVQMGLEQAGMDKVGVTLISLPVQLVCSIIPTMGMLKVLLMYCREQKPGMGDYFAPLPQFLNFIAVLILYDLIVFAGILLLIVPGFIWAIQFNFATYCVIDQGLGPIEALKKSSQLTQGVRWNLFGFYLLCAAIQLAGVICLIIGLIPASMLVALTTAYVYTQCAGLGGSGGDAGNGESRKLVSDA